MPLVGAADNSRIVLPNQGNLRNRAFAFSGRWYLRSLAGSGLARHLWGVGGPASNFGIYLRLFNNSGTHQLEFAKSASGTISATNAVAVPNALGSHRWYHILGESDADPTVTGSIRLWINGVLTSSPVPGVADSLDFTGDLTILGRHNSTTLQTDGACDQFVVVQDRVWTADERDALLAGRIPAHLLTANVDDTPDDIYALAPFRTTLNAIGSGGATITATVPNGAVSVVRFPGDVPDLALWRRADSGAFVDAGTNLATHKASCQQWNDATGIGNGNSSQATANNRPGVKKSATGPGPDALAFGNSNSRSTYNESDQATAKFLDVSGGPGIDPRNCTVVAFGAQRGCQTNGGVSFDFFQYLVHCGTPGTSGVFCCGMARGQLGVYTYNGSSYSNLKQGTLAVSATPCMFGWAMSSTGVTGFVGERTESLGSALPSASPTTGIRIGASPDASPSHNSCAYVDLTALCIYQRVLDATDLAALNAYFADTYSIPKHDTRRVVVLCEGSSTMFGTYSTHNLNFIGSLPDENSRDWKIVNFGTGGLSFTGSGGFDARWSDTLGNSAYWQETPTNRKLIFVLAVNFNDITDGSVTDDQAGADILIERFNDLAARARALRGAVIGVTFFRNYKTTARDLYNAHVTANADVTLDLKILADNAEITIVTGDPHMDADSQEVIGPYLRSAVLEAISVLNNRRGGASRTRPARQRILR